jgi:GNAT superfamily N-acetyltransferase
MQVERIREPADLEEIYVLRVNAWRSRNDKFPAIGRWYDPDDEQSVHWGVRDGGQIVAAARMSIHETIASVPSAEIFDGLFHPARSGRIAALNRLVVARSHRGRGYSQALDEVRIAYAREAGCRHVIGETDAGRNRIRQLGLLGFEAVGTARPYRSGPLAIVKNIDERASDDGHRLGTVVHLRLAPEE